MFLCCTGCQKRSEGSDAAEVLVHTSVDHCLSTSEVLPTLMPHSEPLGVNAPTDDVGAKPVESNDVRAPRSGAIEGLDGEEAKGDEGEELVSLLCAGRLVEGDQLARSNTNVRNVPQTQASVTWLTGMLPEIRTASAVCIVPADDEAGWHRCHFRECGLDVRLFVKPGEVIEAKMTVDLPGTMEKIIGILWEPDLGTAWLPFNPTIRCQHSSRSSSVLFLAEAKIPPLPGTRQCYVYRTLVDCFSPSSTFQAFEGRRGLFVYERSPDNWRTGGRFQDEFDVSPPSKNRWVSRDEQLMATAFYEVLNETTVRAVITMFLRINVPRWILTDRVACWLVKHTCKLWLAGIVTALTNFEKYGYATRIAQSRSHIYRGVSRSS